MLVFGNLDKQTFDNRQDVMMTIKQYQKYTYPHLPFICLTHLRKKKYVHPDVFTESSGLDLAQNLPRLPPFKVPALVLPAACEDFLPLLQGENPPPKPWENLRKFGGLAIKHLGVDSKSWATNQHPHPIIMFLSPRRIWTTKMGR